MGFGGGYADIIEAFTNALSWLVGISQIRITVKNWATVDGLWICIRKDVKVFREEVPAVHYTYLREASA